MRTLLENPTRYHVVQKQKNQVRQYLHESFRGSDEGVVTGIQNSFGSDGGVGGTPLDTGPQQMPMVVHSAPPGPAVHHPEPQHHHMASYPHAPALLPHTHAVTPSPDPTAGAMSPDLSSVATSNSEVSFTL